MSRFSENHKISNNQARKILILDICSVSMLIVPGITASGAGRDGVVSIIAGSILAIAYAMLFLWFSKQIKGDYLDYCQAAVGKFGVILIGTLYLIKFGFSILFLVTLFANVIRDTLLPNTREELILFTLITVSIYAAWKGIEVRGRIAEVLFYIVFIPLVLLLLLAAKNIEITNLFPLFTSSIGEIGSTSYKILLTFSACEFLIFSIPSLIQEKETSGRKKMVFRSIIFAAVFNILLFVVVIGSIGISGAGSNLLSAVTVFEVVKIPGGIVHRQDAIILAFWLLSIFMILCTCFFYIGKIANQIYTIKNRRLYLPIAGLILFFIGMRVVNIDMLMRIYGNYLTWIGLPQSLLIPMLVITAGKNKEAGRRASDESDKQTI